MAHLPPLNIHDVDSIAIGQPHDINGDSKPFGTAQITFTGKSLGKLESVTVQIYGEARGELKRAMLAACNRFLEDAGQ